MGWGDSPTAGPIQFSVRDEAIPRANQTIPIKHDVRLKYIDISPIQGTPLHGLGPWTILAAVGRIGGGGQGERGGGKGAGGPGEKGGGGRTTTINFVSAVHSFDLTPSSFYL